MKAETIKELLFSGDYDTYTVGKFGEMILEADAKADKVVNDTMDAMVEEEKYAKQVERARDILERQEGNRGSYEKEDAFSDDVRNEDV